MIIAVFLTTFAIAYGSNTTGCSYTDTCSVSGISGICASKSSGCCTGTLTAGYCPGSTDIQCCTNAQCSTPYGSGTCKQTSASCSGQYYAGYCAGPADLQCCVSGGTSSGVYGVDISQAASSSTFSCFKSNGFGTFTIPRGYRSSGSVDPNICTNLKNAQTAGIAYREVYLFPCPTCTSGAAKQMSDLVSYLNTNCKSAFSGRVWLDIEGSQYWTTSTSTNKAWYQDLVNSCATYGVRCGVYSSASQWSAIFGSTSYSYGSSNPLWYAHYDNNPSFSDFSSFGGWTKPFAKQYAGDVSLCSFGVDKNYAAAWN